MGNRDIRSEQLKTEGFDAGKITDRAIGHIGHAFESSADPRINRSEHRARPRKRIRVLHDDKSWGRNAG